MLPPTPQTETTDIAIIGMGYVGLTLAVGLAQVGYRVHGVEHHAPTLALLRQGISPIIEPGLDAHYAEYFARGTITIHETLMEACPATAFIITVGTPVDVQQHADMQAIQNVSRMIAAVLKPNDMVMLRSTVKLGTTRNVVKPILDAAAVPYALAMCPERSVEGRAVEELRTLPQIIGGVDAASTARAAAIFQRMTPEVVPVSTPESAEMAKLVCNTQRALFFAYANEVALMADAVGINAAEVIHAANFNYPRSRIGKPGPVGGPCLDKDVYILADGLAEVGFTPSVVMAGRAMNDRIIPHGVAKLQAVLGQREVRKVAVLGLAFKGEPETADIRGSLAIPLMAELRAAFPSAEVVGYDAVATVADAAHWRLPAVATLDAALQHADAVVIQNNHAAFRGAALRPHLHLLAPRAVLYDFWGTTAPTLAEGMDVYHCGLGFDYANTSVILSEAKNPQIVA